MKKIIASLLLVGVMLMGATFMGCGCEHVAGDWQMDDNNHWHVCTLCGENVDLTAHTFEEGVCTVCEESGNH